MIRKGLFAALGALEGFVGLGALAGGAALFFAPDGSILRMPVSLLHGTPFNDYRIPGLILLVANGAVNSLAGILALMRRPSAASAALVAGAIQIGWIVVEVGLVGYIHWAQILYFVFGMATIALALALRHASTGFSETTKIH